MAEAKRVCVEVKKNVKAGIIVLDLNMEVLNICFSTAAHVGEVGPMFVAALEKLLKKTDQRNTATYLPGDAVVILVYQDDNALKDLAELFAMEVGDENEEDVRERALCLPFCRNLTFFVAKLANEKLLEFVDKKLVDKTKDVFRWEGALICRQEGDVKIRIPMEITEASLYGFKHNDGIHHYPLLRDLEPDTIAIFLNCIVEQGCTVQELNHFYDTDNCYSALLGRWVNEARPKVELLVNFEHLQNVLLPFLDKDCSVKAQADGYEPTTFFTLCRTICNVTSSQKNLQVLDSHYFQGK